MSEVEANILGGVVISLTVIFLLYIIGSYFYKKKKGLPVGECSYCHKGAKKLLKEYRKEFQNK